MLFAYVLRGTILVAVVVEVGIRLHHRRPGTPVRITEIPSLLVIGVAVSAGCVLASIATKRLPWLDLPGPHVLWVAVGLPLVWAGIVLRLYAVAVLGRYFRMVVHVQEEHRVIQHGPYRLIRHPAYTGMLVAFLGFGVVEANLAAIVLILAGTFLGLYYRIRVEERTLSASLGAAYTDYAARTARLVPKVW